MSVPAPLVVPLFATPFGVVTLPEAEALNPALRQLFAAREAADWRDPLEEASAHVFHGRDDLFSWADHSVARLMRAMLGGVTAVAASINTLSPDTLASLRIEGRARFTIVHPDGCVSSRNHCNSAWVAVYCVAAPAPSPTRFDSGVLRLHESRLGATFADATTSDTVMPYRPGHSTWRPVPGQMAVFPGAITHEIALIRSTGDLVLVTARLRYVGPDQTGVPWW